MNPTPSNVPGRNDPPPAAVGAQPCITCQELFGFLDDYLDAALAPAQLEEFERHLRVCPSCVNYLEGYRKTVALGKAAFAPDKSSTPASAPPGLISAVRAALERERRNQDGGAGA